MRFRIKHLLIATAIVAFIWSGWIGKPFIRWRSDYKNVLLRGWAGGGQLFVSRGQSGTYWHAYVDIVDAGEWKMQLVAAKK